jgi:YD repeat-containing protein
MSFICFIIWIVFACAVGTAASRHYKRSGFGWGVLAVLISPLLAWLLLLLLGKNPDNQSQPQPPRDLNWERINWTTGEVAKPQPPRQFAIQPVPPEVEAKARRNTAIFLGVLACIIAAIVFVLIISNAGAAEQSRVYAPDGRSIGTVVPQGDGSNRFYDARGNSRGTSTTTGDTTKDYDARGNVLGTTSAPRGDRLR